MLCFGSWRHQIFGCRTKFLFCIGTIVGILVLILLFQKEPKLTSVIDLELAKCPSCYGTSLCTELLNGHFRLVGWNRWKVLRVANQKNVYYADYKEHPVVLKKLAHDWELQQLDVWLCRQAFGMAACDVGEAAAILSVRNDTRKLMKTFPNANAFLQCASLGLLNKIKDVMQKNEPLSNKHANILTLLPLNPEPLIVQSFPAEKGWPFPKYLGACGRLIAETYVGPTLDNFISAHWRIRLRLAYKLTLVAEKLVKNPTPFCLYMTDVDFSNFAVTPKEEIVIVDAENILVSECRPGSQKIQLKSKRLHANHLEGNSKRLVFSVDDLCTSQAADHNYYAVCQGIFSLAHWSEESNGGFLDHLPPNINHRWNISHLVDECCKPSTYLGRFTIFSQLQLALLQASLDE